MPFRNGRATIRSADRKLRIINELGNDNYNDNPRNTTFFCVVFDTSCGRRSGVDDYMSIRLVGRETGVILEGKVFPAMGRKTFPLCTSALVSAASVPWECDGTTRKGSPPRVCGAG